MLSRSDTTICSPLAVGGKESIKREVSSEEVASAKRRCKGCFASATDMEDGDLAIVIMEISWHLNVGKCVHFT